MAADDHDEWVECWNCGGEGVIESCFEDTCVCLDPPCCEKSCDVCAGGGGWPRTEPDPADAMLFERNRTTKGEDHV
jgi:hypothetical protein